MPAISPESLYGAVHLAGDGHLDPHGATHAVADAARALGVRIRTGVRVTGFELSARREITAVLTDAGPIATELVVNAAGIWAPQVAAMVGAFIPSTPVDHQHIALKAVPGSELPREMPCFRDPDNLVYGKSEHGGMVFGGYELDPRSRWEDGVPWEHAAQSLPADYERFAPLMAGAIRRFPFLADAEAIRLVCHPDAMTPDANPLLGPLPGVRGFWVAAGLSLNGFGGGGGIGRAMAGWITAGDPGVDIGPYRAWRFGEVRIAIPGSRPGLARETYSDYYRLRYPFDADLAGRPRRLSALHGRLQEAGAVFGTKAGWERADYHEPGRPWRRAGRDQAEYGWTRPPWFERVVRGGAGRPRAGRSHRPLVVRQDRGRGAGGARAAPAGQRERRRPPRRERRLHAVVRRARRDGGRRDRHAPGRRPVPGRDRRRLRRLRARLAADPRRGRRGASRSATSAATSRRSGCGDRRARDVLVGAGAAADEVGNDAIPMRRSRSIQVGPAPVDAARISYAGELGWELTTPVEWAVTVWDRLRAAGAEFGLEPFGYRALDALRMEKGYRYFGTDLTMLDTPFEAGLGAFVRLDKGPFIGREALVAAHADRIGPRASGPSSSAAPTTNRSTAARPSASTARSSVASAASPTARPSSGRSATRTCRSATGRGHRPRDRRLRSSRRASHRARRPRRSARGAGCAARAPTIVAGRATRDPVVEGAALRRPRREASGSVSGMRWVSIRRAALARSACRPTSKAQFSTPAFPDGTDST